MNSLIILSSYEEATRKLVRRKLFSHERYYEPDACVGHTSSASLVTPTLSSPFFSFSSPSRLAFYEQVVKPRQQRQSAIILLCHSSYLRA